MWLTIKEVCCIWDKHKHSVDLAIWKDKLKARQCVCGVTWLVYYDSVVALWGDPLHPELVEEIKHDVNA